MAKLFILIKRKGSKRFIGAIPAKKGVSVKKLRATIPKRLRSGFSARIVSEAQLKRVISRLSPRRSRKKPFKRRMKSKKKKFRRR